MWRLPRFFGFYAQPSKKLSVIMAIIPFVLVASLYFGISEYRHAQNNADKLVPTIKSIGLAIKSSVYKINKRTGEIENQLWDDTKASLCRIMIGLGLSALCALFLGLNLGLFPGLRAMLNPFVTFISNIPPPAIMPIFLMVFGKDELGKMALIFFGTFFYITRDIQAATEKLPKEQKVKIATLGGSTWDYTYRVALPQIIPRLIDTIRINFGNAWIYLIISESLAAQEGLGYRIFLVRRYLDMATILPYVAWIVLIAFSIDFILKLINRFVYPWYTQQDIKMFYRILLLLQGKLNIFKFADRGGKA